MDRLCDFFSERLPSSLSGTVFECGAPCTVSERLSPGLACPPIALHEVPPPGGPPVYVAIDPRSGSAQSVVIGDPARCEDARPWHSRLADYPLAQNLVGDECNFYSCPSLAWLAAGVGGAAILANTNLDEEFRHFYQTRIRVNDSDLDWGKQFGNGLIVIPSLAGIWLVDHWIDSNSCDGEYPCAAWLEEWSGRSLRGLAVGAVPVLALQYALGASRPGETSAGSHWKPFTDTNSVSGHAYVGAVPMFTAAQMVDNVPLKLTFYAVGLLPGVARIHQDAHYLSQVALGWWIAGLSVAAVDCTDWQRRQWMLTPTMFDNGAPGLTLIRQW